MKLKISAITDVGKVRTNNEDAVAVCTDLTTKAWLQGDCQDSSDYCTANEAVAVIADGLGGQNAGEVASAMVIDIVKRELTATDDSSVPAEAYHKRIKEIIMMADEEIFRSAIENADTRGMGTTVTICWMAFGQAHVAWCGDSRCYHFSPRQGLRQVTKDHSFVQQLIDNGEISRNKAFHHPDNHIIIRGCGDLDCSADPDFADVPLSPGDMLMMCSDGLSGCCYDNEIELMLYKHYTDPAACRDALLNAAIDAGAPDNVSVIVISCIDDCDDAPKATVSMRFKAMVKRSRFAIKQKLGLI
ncbi:MAG: serine/threonine-protein phosphatase [Muribaculaceae bacterium]|nr:serine/threonine-protein phosphatase [Muribaculaceae bacterium]